MEELQLHHIAISMTEDYKPTDNAIAERVNGIIKTESVYVRKRRYKDLQEAEKLIGEFIDFYNNERPHASIGMQTPSAVQTQQGEQQKKWRAKVYKTKTCTDKNNPIFL